MVKNTDLLSLRFEKLKNLSNMVLTFTGCPTSEICLERVFCPNMTPRLRAAHMEERGIAITARLAAVLSSSTSREVEREHEGGTQMVYTVEIQTQMEEKMLSVLKEFSELTIEEIKILVLITNNNGMTVEDLVDVTGFDYITIKEILNNLKDKGLVKSNPRKPGCAERVLISEVA